MDPHLSDNLKRDYLKKIIIQIQSYLPDSERILLMIESPATSQTILNQCYELITKTLHDIQSGSTLKKLSQSQKLLKHLQQQENLEHQAAQEEVEKMMKEMG